MNAETGEWEQKVWRCGTCDRGYDRLRVEEGLVGRVQGIVSAWMGMDLVCRKCKGVQINDLIEHCPCGGEWMGTMNRESTVKDLEVLKEVAEGGGMKMLGEVIEGVLKGL